MAQTIARGEGTILIGDLNRPLNNDRPSFGTKLLREGVNKKINYLAGIFHGALTPPPPSV